MRMSQSQRLKAVAVIRKYFGDDASIRLFGSRVDDNKLGGDYDFYVETSAKEVVKAQLNAQAELFTSCEFMEQPVDIIVRQRSSDYELPIYAVALSEGVTL